MMRKALGKGLAAIIPDEAKAVATTDARQIPLTEIRANPYQPRLNPDHELEELAASIRENGIIQPIVVRRRHDGFEVVVGERRLRASKMAGLTHIPAVISDISEPKMLELALIENVQRTDLDPIETALAYKRLTSEFNLNHEEVAQRVGKSRPAISNALRLLELPQKVRDALCARRISEGHARALLALKSRQTQEEYCARIIQDGLSVRAAERMCGVKSRKVRPIRHAIDPNAAALEDALSQRLGARVRIRQKDDRGEIAVEFSSASERERIVRAILGNSGRI